MTADQLNGAPEGQARAVVMPASFAQELIWTIDRAAPDASLYNVARTRHLRGALDISALRSAFAALVARHEILRTSYDVVDGRIVQVIWPPGSPPFGVVDLMDQPASARLSEAEGIVRERNRAAFDVAREAPLRVALLRLADDDHVLHVDTHHIASDGWSQDIFFRELGELYESIRGAREARLAPLLIQYADYAVWERERLQGERLEQLLSYWRDELAGLDAGTGLPTDFARPALPSDEAFSLGIVLESALVQRLKAVGRKHGATLYMTLLAAYQTLLHRCSGQADVVVGFPVAGRDQPETEGLIGCFVNMVPLRARFAGDPTFADVVRDVRQRALSAFEHAGLPFERLALELHATHPQASSSLVRTVFTMIDLDDDSAKSFGDLDVQPFQAKATLTKFDLELFMRERPAGVTLVLQARTALWLPSTIERWLARLQTLIESVVAQPDVRVSELGLLAPQEREQLAAWNATAREVGPATTIVELIEATIARVPDRVAVVAGAERLSYRELGRRSASLTARLRAAGVRSGEPVGVLLERSTAAVAAILAVLNLGAAYVPLTLPAARLEQQLAQSATRYVIAAADDAPHIPDSVTFISADEVGSAQIPLVWGAQIPLDSNAPFPVGILPGSGGGVAPDSIAYVLFTSGSTGVPKGVAATHANVVHYVRAISRVLAGVESPAAGDGFAALDGWRFAMVGTLAADLGYTALFPALCVGGTLHMPPLETVTDAAAFAAYAAAESIDVLKMTPSHLRALVPGGEGLAAVLPNRWLVLAGEALSFELAGDVLTAGRCRLLNSYGPTETTVGACTFTVTADSLAAARAAGAQTVPIGLPLANARCTVTDAGGRPGPIGVPGELHITGAGVTRGYFGRPDLTNERFMAEPNGDRVYRTGDRVRRLASGALEFLGRLDDQVKIRGHRVEPGEIEARLASHPLVKLAAVRAWGDSGDTFLAAYVVPNDERQDAVSDDAQSGLSHDGRPTAVADAEPESGLAGNGRPKRAGDACAQLRAYLSESLPSYMQPRTIELVGALPLNANGKLDRKRLPRPAAVAVAAAVAPRTSVETEIVALFAAAFRLRADTIGVNDDFVSLGGHSLLAMRLIGEIGRRFGVRLGLRALFDAPTIALLAERVDLEVRLAAVASMSEEEALLALGPEGASEGRRLDGRLR